MRTRARTVATIAMTLVALTTIPAAAASPSPAPGEEQTSFSLVNQERSSRGRSTLSWNSRIASIARDHSEDMARQGHLHHNDDLPSQVGSFAALAENVGYGENASTLHDGFMNSADHRDNILSRAYTQIGIGAVWDDEGTLWITQVFYTPQGSSGSSGGGSGSSGGGSSGGSSSSGDEEPRRIESSPSPSPERSVRAQSPSVRSVREPVRARRTEPRSRSRTASMLGQLAAVDEAAVLPDGGFTPTVLARPTPEPYFY